MADSRLRGIRTAMIVAGLAALAASFAGGRGRLSSLPDVPPPALVRGTSADVRPAESPAECDLRIPLADPFDRSIRRRDESLSYEGTAFTADWTPESARFSLPRDIPGLGRPSLAYRFGELRFGDQVLASGAPQVPQVQDALRQVVYPRGSAVHERYTVRNDGLEQDFIVFELPPGRGPLRVTGTVETRLAPPENTTGTPRLAFHHGGEGVIELRDAVALDAAGRRLPLDLEWTDGQLAMTVPAEWVAEARLPITIDPLMAGMTGLGILPSDLFSRTIQTTLDPIRQRWISSFHRSSGSSPSVYVHVVSTEGQQVSEFSPQDTPGDHLQSAVSFAPEADRFLVVWINRPSIGSETRVMGRVVRGDLSYVGPSFVVADYPYNEQFPSVSWDGARWYVVYAHDYYSRVRGRFISSAGVPEEEVHPAPDMNSGWMPIVRFGHGVHLVFWWQNGTSPTNQYLMARTVRPDGTFGAGPVALSEPYERSVHVDAAAGPASFLVVWDTGSGVKCRQVDASLSSPGAVISLLPREYSIVGSDQCSPRVVYSPANSAWYVLYRETLYVQQGQFSYQGYATPLRARHVYPDGTVSMFEEIADGLAYIVPTDLCINPVLNQALLAVNQGGSMSFLRRVDLSLPRTPANFVAIPGNGQAELRWDPLPGAASYSLARATGSGGPFRAVVSGIPGTSYLDTGLTNGTAYTYQLTAVVDTLETRPNQVHVTPSNDVLLVANSTTLGTGDTAVRTRLQNLGYAVTVRTASATAADAAGKILVVVSSTVSPSTVNTKFRTLVLPVVTWESGIFDDLGMTGTASGTNFGTVGTQTQVVIQQPGHPLAAGLSGTVSVTTAAGSFSWGVPNANAAFVARQVSNASRALIFGYEAGAAMVGAVAPARRVGLFLTDATAASLTPSGGALFDAAVSWATRAGGTSLAAGFASGTGAPVVVEGLGAFATLEQAALAAQPGDVISLGAGIHRLPAGVSLRPGVALLGTAPQETVLDGTGAPSTLVLSATPGGGLNRIERLTVTGGVRGIDVRGAHAWLRNVQIVRTLGDGLVTGPEGAVEAVSVTVADNAGWGVLLGSPQASLRGLIVTGNGRGGLQGPAGARITYSTVSSNGGPAASGGLSLSQPGVGAGAVFFRNPAGLDYRESPGSASINAGDPTDAFRSEPSPHGSRVNQGAFGNTADAAP